MAAPRKNLSKRSNTSSKSSETQTESPQNESQTSTPESSETSTQTTDETDTSNSTQSDDPNDALFADADAEAAGRSESDEEGAGEDQDDQEKNDAPEASQTATPTGSGFTTDTKGNLVSEYGVVATGDPVDFHVKTDELDYTFKGHVENNVIIVSETGWQEVALPGSKRTSKVLMHHRGQTLPLRSYEKYAQGDIKKDQED